MLSESEIKEGIRTRDAWALRALVVVYSNQTSWEQSSQMTRDRNNVGFNGRDARFMTSLAQFYQRKGFLSTKQLSCVKRTMPKYWRQIQVAAERKAETATSQAA